MDLAQSSKCWGHKERENRRNRIANLKSRPTEVVDETRRVLIRKGPVSIETSLQELEGDYETKPEWKMIENGGVLSVPVEELRMEKPPKPDHSGRVVFKEKKGGGGRHIESYPSGQTVENMNEFLRDKYNQEVQNAEKAGMEKSEAEKKAFAKTTKLPQFQAVKYWQDTMAEIKLKRALEMMLTKIKIPGLLIRSVNLKLASALNDMGLKLPEDAEIDLVMAHFSGDFININIFEVKRKDTFPWDTVPRYPNKQAVNKAENQLTEDVDILMALMAGTPPHQIIFNTLACYPDSTTAELETIFCSDCLENGVLCQEDLNSISLLQKKTRVQGKSNAATTCGKHHLLRFTARCLSNQSLLHIGYRSVEDKNRLVADRQKFNIQAVDGKIMQSEYVMASPQQQKAIASFNATSIHKHLILTGAAGTGKTVVALQVANSLIRALEAKAEPGMGPFLLVTTQYRRKDDPLCKYLDAKTSTTKAKILDNWEEIIQISEVLAKRWEQRPIVILVDEVLNPNLMLSSLTENRERIADNITIIAVVNPFWSSAVVNPFWSPDLPSLSESVLHINLTTPYRSTIAITSLARFLAKCEGQEINEGEIGSDVQGMKPLVFDVGDDEVKLTLALERCRQQIGDEATLLYDRVLPTSKRDICNKHGKENGGSWECYNAKNFFGWEAERVVAVTAGWGETLEMATRAKTHLILILAEPEQKHCKEYYTGYRKFFEEAAKRGLIDLTPFSVAAP